MTVDFKIPGYSPYRDAGDEYVYDPALALRYTDFFPEFLTFTKGRWKGQPFDLLPWQLGLIRCMFGWVHKETRKRRYRVIFVFIPRKNGKSELMGGVANNVFHQREEPDAEIYIGAKDKPQALTLYRMTEKMNQQDPELWDQIDSRETTKEIRALWDDSKIQAIPGDGDSAHSYSVSVGIVDEVHVLKNDNMIEALRTGMGAREQPLLIMITTAAKTGLNVCNEELDYALAVRDGRIINPRYLPVIFRAEEEDDWTDPATWMKANPSMPVTPSMVDMEAECNEAQRKPRLERSFRRLRLNQTVDSLSSWINLDDWGKCKHDIDEDALHGRCYSAFDLASKIDIVAMCHYFPDADNTLIWRYYCTQQKVDEDPSGHYQEWVAQGVLTIAGDLRVDFEYLRNDFRKAHEKWNCPAVALDPWAAVQIMVSLENEFPDLNVFEFKQNFSTYNDPCNEVEAMITNHDMRHNNTISDWMASNVVVKEDASNRIRPVKEKRGSPLKIDGIQAMIMAIGLTLLPEEEEPESVYSKREMTIIQ